jgi:hypothetical protein
MKPGENQIARNQEPWRAALGPGRASQEGTQRFNDCYIAIVTKATERPNDLFLHLSRNFQHKPLDTSALTDQHAWLKQRPAEDGNVGTDRSAN